MDSLSCPAGTGMWRIKMKIKKPSHIIKGGGFRVSKIMFHLRTQIQIPSNQHGSIGRFLILLVRIALVTVTDLGRGGAAGGVDGAAFGTYRGPQRHCGGENFAVVLCSFVVGLVTCSCSWARTLEAEACGDIWDADLKETISSEPS